MTKAADAAKLVEQFGAGVHIPDWLPDALLNLVAQAEKLFGENDKARRQWVIDSLKRLAREHDIEAIPDWIETPVEDLIIVTAVTFAFTWIRQQESRRGISARNGRALTSGGVGGGAGGTTGSTGVG